MQYRGMFCVRKLILLLFLLPCSPGSIASDEWFIGSWISDPEKTVFLNPIYGPVDENTRVQGVKNFTGIHWYVSEKEVVKVHPRQVVKPRPIEYWLDKNPDLTYTLSSPEGASEVTILRTADGFCTLQPMLPTTSGSLDARTLMCFRKL